MPRQVQPRRVRVVRYLLDSRRVPAGTPGAERIVTLSSTYYAYLCIGGLRRRVPLRTTDLQVAHQRLRELQREGRERQLGIHQDADMELTRPLEEHVGDWLRTVRARGTTQQQCDTLGAHVRRIAELAGWRRLADLTYQTALEALVTLQQGEGLSAATRNHYCRHVKQFARWCVRVRPQRLRDNPLELLGLVSEETDRRHVRRCPTDAEISALFRYLASPGAAVIEGMSGHCRALGYSLCMATGLRAGELRSLTRESCDLDEGIVVVQASYSKHRRRDVLHLPAWLVAELRDWFAGGGGCWERFPAHRPGLVLQADLAAAGVEYRIDTPEGPKFLDFHSLRHHFCTVVANQPNVSLKDLLHLTRHSSAALALQRYAKPHLQRIRAAVEAIPPPLPLDQDQQETS